MSNTPTASGTQTLVAGALSATTIIGSLLYGVKRGHPWIGLFVGLCAGGVVATGTYAAMGVKPEPMGAPRQNVTALTDNGPRSVNAPAVAEDPTATTTSNRA